MIKIALISDELTFTSLKSMKDVEVVPITLKNAKRVFHFFRPFLFIVESAWFGHQEAWRYQIASYPGYPERNNDNLRIVVELARYYNIPTVFWNKEDGAHFHRFIKTAALFDYVLTVDINMLPFYRKNLTNFVKIGALPFAISSKIHYSFPNFHLMSKSNKSLFIGSYSQHIHESRKKWQDIFFKAASNHGLVIYDRNSNRKSEYYRYPDLPNLQVKNAVPYYQTGSIYRKFNHCLNVNTVENSSTMFSRRLIEIMACGTLAVTNPSVSVSYLFNNMCEVVSTQEEANDLLIQLSYGLTNQQKEMCQYASEHVLKYYTYETWLDRIKEFVGIG